VLRVGRYPGQPDEVLRHPSSVAETVAEPVTDTEGFQTRCGRKISGMATVGRIVSHTYSTAPRSGTSTGQGIGL
ncbi:MAG TPA: hypothetical protein VK053_09110, partial [Jiangellaceae bacterium]|nr:hypothetical protein [Jiangellaceae bacterium]